MGYYRKRPVIIEAVHWNGENVEAVQAFINAHHASGQYEDIYPRYPIVIETLEGDMTAQVGDWIICGVKGELYPCKPDIFAATYEAV